MELLWFLNHLTTDLDQRSLGSLGSRVETRRASLSSLNRVK
jgi:hypothetical protein